MTLDPLEPERYCDRPFPPYAFVPGEHPHPTRDPRGHSYCAQGDEAPVPSIEPEDWSDSADYLYGADLYNAGFLWEAHEAWEGLWHVSKHNSDQAQFIQGLIQCAAGCLKIRMGQPRGMQKLFAQGIGRLRAVVKTRGGRYMGLDILEFVDELESFGATQPESAEGRPGLELVQGV